MELWGLELKRMTEGGKMVDYARIEAEEGQVLEAVRDFFVSLLDKGVVEAIMVPTRLPYKGLPMQTLVVDPARIRWADPLAPVVPTNGARFASQLTRDETGKRLALVMRPCEIRPFVELVKLKQARVDNTLLIGLECLGRYENSDFLALDQKDPSFSVNFYRAMKEGRNPPGDGFELAEACKACEHPVPEGVDIRICLIGEDLERGLALEALTERGKEALGTLGLSEAHKPPEREGAIGALLEQRISFRDKWLEEIFRRTSDLGGLMEVLANCINCYNCRVACPVCYCRECVFVTDTFQHDSEQFFRWARKKGSLRMPTDTVFYHLTRMQHMSTLCVGCGQCSSVCPSEIPVSQLFRSIAMRTQALFSYEPGRDLAEPQPLAVFYDNEFQEIASSK
jgi:formate dehydrogenase subunit beta